MPFLSCPISTEKVDERVVRSVALQVSLLSAWFILAPNPLAPLLLFADFLARGTNSRKFSPLRAIGLQIKTIFGRQEKAIDYAPKRFAAQLGLGMATLMVILTLLGLELPAQITAAIFLLLSILEWAATYCVGCIIYSFLYFQNDNKEGVL